MTCDHTYEKYGHTGKGSMALCWQIDAEVYHILRCTKCRHEDKQSFTDEELKALWHENAMRDKLHILSREVESALGDLRGWDAMEVFERLEEKHKGVYTATIDDTYFSSSTLAFVECKNEEEYWGTHVYVVPQCSGQDVFQFFMYPDHVQGVLEALQKLDVRAKNEMSDDPWVVVRKSRVKEEA